MKKSSHMGAVLLSLLTGVVFAGDLPFIQVLPERVGSSPTINDLGEILYFDNTLTLYSTERGYIASDVGGIFGISNSGEIVYGRRTQRDIFSTTRGVLGSGDAPKISPTTGEVAYHRQPDFKNVTTLQGLVDTFDPIFFTTQNPDVNDLGEVVYDVVDRIVGRSRVYSTTRGWLTPTDVDALWPAISNTGEVVYMGFGPQGFQQIFSTTRGQLTSFGGAFSTAHAGRPDIDSFGSVIFSATVNGLDAVYLLPAGPVVTATGGDTQECTQEGGTDVEFTASGPLLPPGETVVNYQWMLDSSPVGTGPQITLFIGSGQHVVEAIATTSTGETRNGSTVIEIVDTTAPLINTTFFDSKTGTMITSVQRRVNVEVSIDVSDVCDPAPTSTSGLGLSVQNQDVVNVKSNKKDSSIALTSAPNTDNVVLSVSATDASGNVSAATVVLPVTP